MAIFTTAGKAKPLLEQRSLLEGVSERRFKLSDAPEGLWLRVLSVSSAPKRAGEGDVSRRLSELGFYAGERAQVRRSSFMGGPMAVSVGPSIFALRPFEAALIEVEPLPESEIRERER